MQNHVELRVLPTNRTDNSVGLIKLLRHGLLVVLCGLLSLSLPAHSATKTLLVLGDSLSAEYGLPRGSGWVSLLEKQLRT
jgi:acyl-CoA thioesterase-1